VATAEDVAQWMLKEVMDDGPLYQITATWQIGDKFSKTFVYINDNGNPAMSKDVLKAYNEISADLVVWSKGGRYWRKCEKSDDPGVRQVSY